MLELFVGHVHVGVKPCERCIVVALLPRIAKLPPKQWFQDLRVDWSKHIAPLLNEGNILSFDDLSGGSI